jgi:hypothetical protein
MSGKSPISQNPAETCHVALAPTGRLWQFPRPTLAGPRSSEGRFVVFGPCSSERMKTGPAGLL